MSDNWSTFSTLAVKGDWLEWTVTLDADAANALNAAGSGSASYSSVSLRAGVQVIDDVGSDQYMLIVNDWLAVGSDREGFSQGGGWNDAGRFCIGIPFQAIGNQTFNNSRYAIDDALPYSFEAADLAGTDAAPWVVGDNVIRLVNVGEVPIDVDFVMLVTEDAMNNVHAQNSAETVHPEYATHTNGTPLTDGLTSFNISSSTANVWFLKAPDATTGDIDNDPTIDVRWCRTDATHATAKLHVHAGAANATGDVGAFGGADLVLERATLVAGRATIVLVYDPDIGPSAAFLYGGSASMGMEHVGTEVFIGCSGWHVGRIGVGR